VEVGVDDGEDAELGGAELARDHHARAAQRAGGEVVDGRPEVTEGARAHPHEHPPHEVEVLQGGDEAPEGALRGAAVARAGGVEGAGVAQRALGGVLDEGAEARLQALDALVVGAAEGLDGDLAVAQERRLGERGAGDDVFHGAAVYTTRGVTGSGARGGA
jgi:hypothetical protein